MRNRRAVDEGLGDLDRRPFSCRRLGHDARGVRLGYLNLSRAQVLVHEGAGHIALLFWSRQV